MVYSPSALRFRWVTGACGLIPVRKLIQWTNVVHAMVSIERTDVGVGLGGVGVEDHCSIEERERGFGCTPG